ncbi:MAG: sugar ABC transporter ATP-binding protein [Solirubrobacterales bacterium]
MAIDDKPLVSLRGISKSYPGVRALSNVDLDFNKGEIHALLGPNGAGKSTLARIVGGVEPADGGEMRFAGEQIHQDSPAQAAARGIVVVHQGLNLFPGLTVSENLSLLVKFASSGPLISWRREREASLALLTLLEHDDIDPQTPITDLSVGEMWIVALTAALATDPLLLVLDESTAALSHLDADRVFSALRSRVEQGLAVIVVSHRLGEIREIADRITVLRGGSIAGMVGPDVPTEELIRLMYGEDELEAASELGSAVRAEVNPDSPPVFEVKNVSTETIHDVSLSLRPSEVFGLAGALGSGRSEVLRAIGGLRQVSEGSLALDGKNFAPRSPGAAISQGVVLVPEDRDANGIFAGQSVSENMTMSSLGKYALRGFQVINRSRERTDVDSTIDSLSIKGRADQPIETLSGGNRQKVLLARAMLSGARVLLLDDPTSGLDIASRAELAHAIHRFADTGGVVLIASDEFDELIRICTNIGVMRNGRLADVIPVTESLSEQDLAVTAYA